MKSETRRQRMLRMMLEANPDDKELREAYEATLPKKPPTPSERATTENRHYEGEAVLAVVYHPDKFTEKLCAECNQLFATNNPKNVTLCSVECVRKQLVELGIDWNPDRSLADRWPLRLSPPPLIVPPEALERLRTLVSLTDAAQEPPSEEVPDSQAS